MTKTCFPEDLGGACLRASAEIGTNRGALSHLAIVVQKLTHFHYLGAGWPVGWPATGFWSQKCMQAKELCPVSWTLFLHGMCVDEVSSKLHWGGGWDSQLFLQEILAQGECITGCLWGAGRHLDAVLASRDGSFAKALGKMNRTDRPCGQHLCRCSPKGDVSMAAQSSSLDVSYLTAADEPEVSCKGLFAAERLIKNGKCSWSPCILKCLTLEA